MGNSSHNGSNTNNTNNGFNNNINNNDNSSNNRNSNRYGNNSRGRCTPESFVLQLSPRTPATTTEVFFACWILLRTSAYTYWRLCAALIKLTEPLLYSPSLTQNCSISLCLVFRSAMSMCSLHPNPCYRPLIQDIVTLVVICFRTLIVALCHPYRSLIGSPKGTLI